MSELTEKNPRYFYDSADFPELSVLEINTDMIKTELMSVLKQDLNNQWLAAFPDYVKSDFSEAWKTFTFCFFQMQSEYHRKLCPKTAVLLDFLPSLLSCDFSILKPHTHISPHQGFSKMILRCHLPLIVPSGKKCGIRVGDETYYWEEGKLIIFDDSFEHEAWNNSDEIRVVLMFDIPNPHWGYSAEEIAQFKIKNLSDPFLLSIASKEQWMEALSNKKLPIT